MLTANDVAQFGKIRRVSKDRPFSHPHHADWTWTAPLPTGLYGAIVTKYLPRRVIVEKTGCIRFFSVHHRLTRPMVTAGAALQQFNRLRRESTACACCPFV